MRQRSKYRPWTVALRLLSVIAFALTLASCDKCGDFIFGSPKSQACKGETAPR